MPTLEPEPCRTRSSSFRHSRENTPGSSPTGSRSNSPSPSSPTTISLTIPKSRSFSLASLGPVAMGTKRNSRERRSLHQTGSNSDPNLVSPNKGEKTLLSPLTKPEGDFGKGVSSSVKDSHPGLSKRLNITSDYESSDSPGSSDHSDNVMGAEDSVNSLNAAHEPNTETATPFRDTELRERTVSSHFMLFNDTDCLHIRILTGLGIWRKFGNFILEFPVVEKF